MTGTKYHSSSFVGEITMSDGRLKLDRLEWLLDTIPTEVAFVDVDSTNRYFNKNKGQKAFERPKMALDYGAFSCHSPKVGPPVCQIIGEFYAGWQSSVSVWVKRGGETMLVNYHAVWDVEGNYLSIAEFVQGMESTKRYFQQGGEKQND